MSIGIKLKEAREKKQLTLRQAYEKTRIHPDILEAMERDDYKKIPNQNYIKSFLKEYASFLGLGVNEIMEEYNKSKAVKQKKPAATQPKTPLPGAGGIAAVKSLSRIVTLIVKWSVIAALGVIVMLGLFKLSQSAVKNIKLTAKQSAVKPKQDNIKPGSLKKKTEPRQAKPVEKKSQKIIIPKDKELSLSISAIDNVWLQLKIDGKIIFQNILKKGICENWKARENFTISTKKADALQLNLNGNNLGPAGKGSVKGLVIDREGIHK
ncbi:MAG: DUF4115 domain-containing protein [Candidatus Omnitrophica bacterium]|nr:DUF4115 domain-containing protein [Candidatus Omnitrophota bacterium]